jgi:hypothetical protein
MSKDESYVAKSHAIRACLVEHPEAAPQRVVDILSAQGTQVSPAHVIVVQTVLRAEKAERVPVAS